MPLRRWSHQPPIGLQYRFNPALPQPWAVFRPLGDKLQAYGAAITSTTYTSVTAATTRDGYGIKIAGAGGDGVKVAYTDQMDRSTWAVAVIVRVDGSGTTQTIIGMNGDLNGLQARVNTSAQLELLRQGAVLLVTSSYAGFTAGSVHCVVIRNPNGTSDSITAWANGKLIATNSSGVDNSASDSALYFGQRFAGVSQSLNGAIVEAAHWSGTIPTAEQCQAISADYWGTVVEPRRAPGGIPGAAAGGGATNLVVADALHGHAADNLVLTSEHLLTVADALHGHAADNLVLTSEHLLTVADALHAHAADNVVLTSATALTLADALHAHAADNVVLEVAGSTNLVVQDALHDHLADVLALTSAHLLIVADATHGHTVDGLTLTVASVLALQDALHAHAADNLTLDAGNGTNLLLADALHAHTADGVALTVDAWLVVADGLHAHAADNVILTIPGAFREGNPRAWIVNARQRFVQLAARTRVAHLN